MRFWQGQLRSMKETLQPLNIFADLAHVRADDPVKVEHVGWSEVGHPVVLQVLPEILDRIELGSIRRESLQPQTRKTPQKLADRLTLVHRAAIPHHDDWAAQVTQKGADKCRCPFAVDILLRVTPAEMKV